MSWWLPFVGANDYSFNSLAEDMTWFMRQSDIPSSSAPDLNDKAGGDAGSGRPSRGRTSKDVSTSAKDVSTAGKRKATATITRKEPAKKVKRTSRR